MVKSANHARLWVAWVITLGETLLLVASGVFLSLYWLMLPVWMRSMAGLGLVFALALVVYRFFKFCRKEKAADRLV